jgi:hypothetical protein
LCLHAKWGPDTAVCLVAMNNGEMKRELWHLPLVALTSR